MSDFEYDPTSKYEVELCGLKDDGEGGLAYCDSNREAPKVWCVYVRMTDNEGCVHVNEDEDFITEEEAGNRAGELTAKYGDCGFEQY